MQRSVSMRKQPRSYPERHALSSALRTALPLLTRPGARIVVAVSGGADSVALLTAWRTLWKDAPNRLVVAHFDHQLRDGSDADAEWVAKLAAELGLRYESGVWTREQVRASESAARTARYRFLTNVAEMHGASAVATAHTADDQVETVLHAVLRGTGLHGLCGMRPSRRLAPDLALVRPLLGQSRAALRRYLTEHGWTWREDPSNADPKYTGERVSPPA